MRPRSLVVRAVEYEVLPRDLVASIVLDPVEVKQHFAQATDLAIVKCVCVHSNGERFTCIADAEDFQKLLETGEASDPAGVTVRRSTWPVILNGWYQAN